MSQPRPPGTFFDTQLSSMRLDRPRQRKFRDFLPPVVGSYSSVTQPYDARLRVSRSALGQAGLASAVSNVGHLKNTWRDGNHRRWGILLSSAQSLRRVTARQSPGRNWNFAGARDSRNSSSRSKRYGRRKSARRLHSGQRFSEFSNFRCTRS